MERTSTVTKEEEELLIVQAIVKSIRLKSKMLDTNGTTSYNSKRLMSDLQELAKDSVVTTEFPSNGAVAIVQRAAIHDCVYPIFYNGGRPFRDMTLMINRPDLLKKALEAIYNEPLLEVPKPTEPPHINKNIPNQEFIFNGPTPYEWAISITVSVILSLVFTKIFLL